MLARIRIAAPFFQGLRGHRALCRPFSDSIPLALWDRGQEAPSSHFMVENLKWSPGTQLANNGVRIPAQASWLYVQHSFCQILAM